MHIIYLVHDLAKSNNQNLALSFSDRLGSPLENDDTPDNADNAGSLSGVDNENDDRNRERKKMNKRIIEKMAMRYLMRMLQAATTLHKSTTNPTTISLNRQEWKPQEWKSQE